jgi:hypothetical protein
MVWSFLRIAQILPLMVTLRLTDSPTSELVSHRFIFYIINTMLINITENDFGKATVNITQVGTFTVAPYRFKLTPLKQVERVVKAGAGLGKI